jgi:hypothetical protein
MPKHTPFRTVVSEQEVYVHIDDVSVLIEDALRAVITCANQRAEVWTLAKAELMEGRPSPQQNGAEPVKP